MQVHCDEGVATRIGPKPCAGIREDVSEASAGERAGQPLSRDRKLIPGADTVCVVEGKMSKSANASAWPVPSRFVLELIDAVSGRVRILDQAARSIGLSASFWVRVCQPSTLRMVI